jgi:transcriptional regulator with GAF, ATPase, and Fis domain
MNPAVKGFASDALTAIDAWNWPGNVRELENRIKRAVIMADGKLVTALDLDLPAPDENSDNPLNLKTAREATDRRVIRHALARSEAIYRAPRACSGSADRRFMISSSNTISSTRRWPLVGGWSRRRFCLPPRSGCGQRARA